MARSRRKDYSNRLRFSRTNYKAAFKAESRLKISGSLPNESRQQTFCFKHKPQPESFLYFSNFNPNLVPLRIGVLTGIQIESDNLESVFSIECNCIFIAGLYFKNAHSCAGSFCRIGNCIPQQRSDAFAAHISRSSGSSRH
mgnify:CR=1 FL=1